MSDNAEIYSFHPLMLAIILSTQVEKPSAMGIIGTCTCDFERMKISELNDEYSIQEFNNNK